MRSMTGFGQGESRAGDATVRVSVRSLNGRALEVRTTLPSALVDAEPLVLSQIRGQLHRGRVDVRVELALAELADGVVERRFEEVERLYRLLDKVQHRCGIEQRPTLNDLLQAGLLQRLETAAQPPAEALMPAVEEGLDEALGELLRFRRREGEVLAHYFAEAIQRLERIVDRVIVASAEGCTEQRARLEARVARLLSGEEWTGATRERVAAEVVVLAQRADIEEEVQRSRMHLARLRELIARGQEDGGATPLGKRLDFLLQELLRETNTMASKAASPVLTHHTVDAKTIIEQMREQAQNIE